MTANSTRPTSTDPKLTLNRTTLRSLTDTELRQVAGASADCWRRYQ